MNKIITYTLFFIFFGSLPNIVSSQQLPQFTQYQFNTIAVNPAYAGASDFFTINLLNRNQWVGIEGAPVTQTISVNSSVPNSNFGVGLSAINDKLGFEKNSFVYADISYTLDIGYKSTKKISFGLKAGASKFGISDDILQDNQNSNDDYLNSILNQWRPDVGLGVYYRSEYFYLGLSAPKLFDFSSNSISNYQLDNRLNYYFNGGYLKNINSRLKLRPSFLVKYVNGSPLSVDLSTFFILNEKVWLGANYRYKDAIGATAKLSVFEGFEVGYAYEFPITDLGRFTSGSHEVLLIYKFKVRDCRCPYLYN